MYLKRIIITNFKNVATADLEFSSKINCICGNNGEGKTNLLDAIYYLSMTKSFLLSSDQYTYRHGTDEAALHGVYINPRTPQLEEHIAMSIRSAGEKIVKRNSKAYPRISQHLGLLPVVIISPSDTALILDSGEERRRFMNIVLSQTDSAYLHAMQSYNKILQQRNKLLKQLSENSAAELNPSLKLLLETFNAQLSKDASLIYCRRMELVEYLKDKTQYYYEVLSGGKETVSMEYVSDLAKSTMDILLESSLSRDLLLRYTSVGVQRDDIAFTIDSHPMRKCSSQGQQKSFLIALKLAQFSMMKGIYGFPPILLLDDVFDKLDMKRVEYLIGMVAKDEFGQIFVTDSNKVRIEQIVNSITQESKFFSVISGEFSEGEGKA